MTDPRSRPGTAAGGWAAPDLANPYPTRPDRPYAQPGQPYARPLSGLFPAGPPRPVYREEFPASIGTIALGAAGGAVWMALFGLLADGARGYAWWSIVAGLLGWLAAGVLVRHGDRGVATGVAASTGLGVAIAGVVVAVRFVGGHWLLW